MNYRLMYVSKSTETFEQLDPVLTDIITQSIHFNGKNQITGVLYYGNGYFLQYLEGDQEVVEALFYQKIVKDHRHYHCEIIYAEHTDQPLFSRWSMKFAPINNNIKNFFLERHLDGFNPYLLTQHSIPDFIEILIMAPDHIV